MIDALCLMLYALCCMLYALCSMLYAVCCMLYASCFLLNALCFMRFMMLAFWSIFDQFLKLLGGPGGGFGGSWVHLGGSWGPDWLQEPSRYNFWKIWPQLGGQLGVPKFYFMLKNFPKRPPGAIQGRSCRVSEKDLKMEGTWDRFFIDFGTVWGGPGPLKIVFSYHSGNDFTIFGFLNIKSNLSHQKHRFWLRFGGHVGVQKRTCWLQEPSWGRST